MKHSIKQSHIYLETHGNKLNDRVDTAGHGEKRKTI